MKLIVIPKNKKQEKAVKNFLEGSAIDFTIAEEDAFVCKAAPKKTIPKKKKIYWTALSNLLILSTNTKKEKRRQNPSSNFLMSFNIITTPPFEKEIKQLAKKYPSIKKDISL